MLAALRRVVAAARSDFLVLRVATRAEDIAKRFPYDFPLSLVRRVLLVALLLSIRVLIALLVPAVDKPRLAACAFNMACAAKPVGFPAALRRFLRDLRRFLGLLSARRNAARRDARDLAISVTSLFAGLGCTMASAVTPGLLRTRLVLYCLCDRAKFTIPNTTCCRIECWGSRSL